MKYPHILSAFVAEPWAMQREKLQAVSDFLLFKANGGDFTAEELSLSLGSRKAAEPAANQGAVAVIPVYGVLSQRMDLMSEISGGTSYSTLKQALHEAISNDDVKAIVLDIDSPGGTVPGTDELSTEMRKIRGGEKPIIAQVNALAASAAYWIAASADEIVVTPSGRAGSIGVYTAHDDMSALLEKAGVTRTYISAGKYKVEGNETEELSKESRAYIQSLVDTSYEKFVGAVAEGRGVTSAKVLDSFGQGRMFHAEALLERGMVDRIATLDETLARFGADQTPAAVRRVKAANASKADAASLLVEKMRAGENITKRELENGLKGLVGLSNSEAERAARLYLKDDQGAPDDDADAAALAALRTALAEAKSFKIK